MIPNSTFNFVAQMTHVLGGSLLTLAPVYLFGDESLIYSVPIVLVIAAFKEFYIDYKYEDADTRGSSLLDFIMYCVGICVTLLLVWIKQ